MAICTFFQQGRCRFGDQCRNEHPRSGGGGGGGFASQNRFGAFNNASSGGGGGGGAFGLGGNRRQNDQPEFGLSASDITSDLTPGKGRPEWILSCYGPGKNAPIQLFGGPEREQSFEEMRLRHYAAIAAGNPQQAINEAAEIYSQAEQQMGIILKDVEGAMKYVINGQNEHPNRIDICEGKITTQQPAFGQNNTPAAFGQPSEPQPGAFGNPPTLGQSTIGQPSAFGQAQGAFGQTNPLNQGSAFGQTSAIGQGTAFGNPSGLGGGNPPFGQPSTLGQGAGFGQTSALGAAKPAFGQTGFGQQTQQPAFGQPSAPATASPFGQQPQQQPQTTANPFGQPPQAAGFGRTSAPPAANPFGQQPPPQQQSTPFGQTAPASTPAFSGGFGQTTAPSGFGQTSADSKVVPATTHETGHFKAINFPYADGETRKDPRTNNLVLWHGQQVKYMPLPQAKASDPQNPDLPHYRRPDGSYERIIFPSGKREEHVRTEDLEGDAEEYTPEVTEAWEYFKKNGVFKDGIVPSVPPKQEWLDFDF